MVSVARHQVVPTGSALVGLLGLDWLVARTIRTGWLFGRPDWMIGTRWFPPEVHGRFVGFGLAGLIVSAIRRSSVLRVPWQAVSFVLVAALLLGSSGAVAPLVL